MRGLLKRCVEVVRAISETISRARPTFKSSQSFDTDRWPRRTQAESKSEPACCDSLLVFATRGDLLEVAGLDNRDLCRINVLCHGLVHLLRRQGLYFVFQRLIPGKSASIKVKAVEHPA